MPFVLKAEERKEKGTSLAKKLRREGYLPAVAYGRGEGPILVKVPFSELQRLSKEAKGESVLIELRIGRKKHLTVLKEVQRDVVTGEPLHLDFHILHKGEKVSVTIPIVLVGKAKGEKKGGVVEQLLREIEIRALPRDIPPHIEVDISELDIGDTIHVRDVSLENVEIITEPEAGIATVLAPRKVEKVAEEEVKEEVPLEEKEEEAKEEKE